MQLFFKLTVNHEEYEVKEFCSKQALYSYLYDKKIKGLSPYEDGEFFITNTKRITVNGMCLKLSELYFDSLNYIFLGIDKDGITYTIFEQSLNEIHSLEIEL